MAKIKKLLSTVIAVAMLISCFTGLASAEDVTTTITQNGVSLDGAEDMPLSFTPTVTFSSALPDGTDLSGITLTTGETTLTPTITQGDVTTVTAEETGESTSTFTTATVATPVLKNGTTYTLSVPAIGDNAAAEATFTTVDDGYILKEDFNDGLKVDMYPSHDSKTRVTAAHLQDTDSDGVKDSFYTPTSYHSPTIKMPTVVPITDMTEVIYDMRVRFRAESDSLRNSDGTINASGDGNNGGLMKMVGTNTGGSWARIRTNADGEMTYGNTNGDLVNSGYKLYENTWYNIKITLGSARKTMKVYIEDDAGNSYSGEFAVTSYNGTEVNSINELRFSYGSYIDTAIDYIYVYNNASDAFGEVAATYGENGTSLEDAVAVPRNLEANISFENAITKDDMAKIVFGNSSGVEKTLSEDGKTVTLQASALEARTQYIIHIPVLAGNASKIISFTTADEDWYIVRAEFDGLDDTSKWGRINAGGAYQTDGSNAGAVDATNGWMNLTQNNSGYGSWCYYFGTGDNAYQIDSTKENIYVETRFKKTADFKTNELLTINGRRLTQSDTDNYKFLEISSSRVTVTDEETEASTVTDYLAYTSGTGIETTVTDYKLEAEVWYTLKVRLDYADRQGIITITNETTGESAEFTAGFLWRGDNVTWENITQVSLARMDYIDGSTYVDYIRVYDTDLYSPVSITYGEKGVALNGAKDLSTDDLTAYVKFENAITAEDAETITVEGAEVDATLSDDGKTVTMKISGLTSRTSYKLTVPAIGTNASASATFMTADDPWYIYRAEFDGLDDDIHMVATSGTTENEETESKVANGILSIPKSGGGWTSAIKMDTPIDLTGKTDMTLEMRVRYFPSRTTAEYITAGKKLFRLEGASTNAQLGFGTYRKAATDESGNTLTDEEGNTIYNYKLWYGGNGDNSDTGTAYDGFKWISGEWYTVKIDFSSTSTKFDMSITPDSDEYESFSVDGAAGASYAVNVINYFVFSYRYDIYADVDYIRVIDNSVMPKAEAIYGEYGEKLDGAGAVNDGEEVTVSFGFAVTEDDLSAITLDGEAVKAVLSADGLKATIILPDMTPRTFHTLAVAEIGNNKANEFTFRAADEGKYLYRAEFDGYDDDSVWYVANGNSISDESNATAALDKTEGKYTISFNNHMYRTFIPIFKANSAYTYNGSKSPLESHAIDCTGKENVTIETRVKVGEGILDEQFMYMGNNIAMLGIGANNELRYDANAGTGKGTPFMVNDAEFIIEPDVWYTIKFDFDFAAQRYSVSVDNGNGDIANSGMLSFIYNHEKNEICDFRFSRMLNSSYAPMTIDYFRIIDEDYGKVKVTYDDGIELNGSVLIEADDVYTFEALKEVTDTSNITLVDEDGEMIAINCTASGNTVTIDPTDSEMNYNTKYTLTIPKACIGSDSDQVVSFATKWDETAAFEYPEGYSADDALNVVYFGGSITNQEGWRVYSTNWFKEHFPNAICYNSAVGGTGSEYGWKRLGKDVISKNPDVVFVEFAVNDSTSSTTTKYMESIVRNLNELEKKPVIIFVYTANINFSTNTYTISEHERLAKAYGIPSINIHDYALSLYNTDSDFAADWDNKVYLGDGTHPSATGNQLYGEYVTSLMTSDASKYFVKPASNASVTALTDYKDYVYAYEEINKTLTVDDNAYTVNFRGSEFIVQYKRNETSGTVKIVIDGDEENATVVDTYGASMPFGHQISFMDIEPGEHTAVITLLTDEANEAITLGEQKLVLQCAYWKGLAGAEFTAPIFDRAAVTAGELLTATASYTAYSEEDVYFAIALYDAEGRLTGISKLATTTDDSGVEREISVSVTPKTGDAKAKAFIWNSVSGMEPLAECDSIGF